METYLIPVCVCPRQFRFLAHNCDTTEYSTVLATFKIIKIGQKTEFEIRFLKHICIKHLKFNPDSDAICKSLLYYNFIDNGFCVRCTKDLFKHSPIPKRGHLAVVSGKDLY